MFQGKLLALIIAFLFSIYFGILIFGFFYETSTNFIVYKKETFSNWNNLFTICFAILGIYFLLQSKNTSKKRILNQSKSIILTSLGLILVFPLMTKVFFEESLMRFLHEFSSTKEVSKTVTVGKKTVYKFCWKGVHIKDTSFTSRARICGLSEDILTKLKEGDKVILIGLDSPFGFELKSLQTSKAN